MVERVCYWQLDPYKSEKELKCSNLDLGISNCPYKYTFENLKDPDKTKEIQECRWFIPLDNIKDYFNKKRD